MKTTPRILAVLFLFMALACSKDDGPGEIKETPKSDAKAMTSFVFNAADNAALTANYTATVTETSKTVATSVPNGTDVSALTPVIQVSAKASVSPTGAQNFSSPVTYTVTAEDGSKATYTVGIAIEVAVATLSSMNPTSGPKTTVVTFTGNNFGTDASAVQVFFDDIETPVQSVTNTEIRTSVPPRAFAGAVKVIVNGTEFTNFTFEYISVDIQVSTLAGSTYGFADGLGANAQFNSPHGIAIDASGTIYVSEYFGHKIRKITPAGEVSTLAGSTVGFANGSGDNARFNYPYGIAIDASGAIYVADHNNHRIRKITPAGVVSTLAGGYGFTDGSGANARFNKPMGIAIDASGTIYVADYGNHRIRKITPGGVVSTLAGSTEGFADGSGANAQFDSPLGIAVDASGTIYVADGGNHKIRKITSSGVVSTLAGSTEGFADGSGNNARFDYPNGIAIDASGVIYVVDNNNNKIRKITPAGLVSTLAGSTEGFADGSGVSAQFYSPRGIAIDASGTIYVADSANTKIRKITQE